MDIGIIGAGSIGGTVGKLWAEAGHKVMLSSRHPEELQGLVDEIGGNARYGTPAEAAEFGEVVLLAIPLRGRNDTVPEIEYRLKGKVVIDAMNPFPGRDGAVAEEVISREVASGVATAEQLQASAVARAFSSVHYVDLQSEAHREGEKVAIPIAADDPEARAVAEELVRDAGFEPYDLGGLADSKPLDPQGELFGSTLTAAEIKQILGSK